MNIAECSLIYICAINNPHIICSLIYFALPILLFIATFTHVLPRPPRRRRGRFIVPVPTNTTKWRCVFPSLILQFIVSYPRNCIKWRCNSHHFDISKPFGLDCKTGAMNRPLRLTVCSLPYICVINEYCGMFVDIYMRNK